MNLIFQNSNTHIGRAFVIDSNREASQISITAICLSQKSIDQFDPSNGAPDTFQLFNITVNYANSLHSNKNFRSG